MGKSACLIDFKQAYLSPKYLTKKKTFTTHSITILVCAIYLILLQKN